jgi:hypothetical protein
MFKRAIQTSNITSPILVLIFVSVLVYASTGSIWDTMTWSTNNNDNANGFWAYSSIDTDSDALSDEWEQQYFGNLNQTGSADVDSDGLINSQEYLYLTDPTKSDTDGDGSDDGEEVEYETDPLDANDTPRFSKAWRAVIPFILNQ